jgi:hypothetical protein
MPTQIFLTPHIAARCRSIVMAAEVAEWWLANIQADRLAFTGQ